MTEKFTIAQGVDRLLSPSEDEVIEDLVACERKIKLDVSFAVIETDEADGIKLDKPEQAFSVILTLEALDGDGWNFSRVFFANEGETLQQLAQRIAQGLGIRPDERVWEEAG